MDKKALLFPILFSVCTGLIAQTFDYSWGVNFGGVGEDVIRAISVDDDGNIYSTGYFTDNADFDPGAGTTELVSNGFYDIFVQKIDSEGNLVWAKSFGGPFFDYGTSVETDELGNVYVTGVYEDVVTFASGDATSELTSSGAQDIFVLKLSPEGDFIWVKSMGGTGYEEATSIGTDGNGAIYVSGYFNEPGDYDPGETEFELTSNGGQDGFVVKLSNEGSFEWAHNFGSEDQLLALGMDVNDFGDVFLTGPFQGAVDFNPGEADEILEIDAGQGGYVLKLNSAGEFGYAVVFGGDQNDTPWDIAVDSDGSAYSAGGFRGEFTAGNTTYTGVDFNEEAFVVKVNPLGMIEWVNAIQGIEFQNAYDVNTDASGNVVLAGYFNGTADFDPSESATVELTGESAEPFDAFYAVYDTDGNYVDAGQFGGSNFVEHHGVDADAEGNIYLGAAFQGTVNLNPEVGETENVSSAGFRDSYIIKLQPSDITGIADVDLAPSPPVFPNPAADVLNIQIADRNAVYSIRDMAGREVQGGTLNGPELQRISVGKLESGAYILLVPGYAPAKWIKQ